MFDQRKLADGLAEVSKAISHPTRLGFFAAVANEDKPLSPVIYARAHGQPVPAVAYHVLALEQAGMIVLVDRIARRGAIEHRYRPGGRNSELALGMLKMAERARRGDTDSPPEE